MILLFGNEKNRTATATTKNSNVKNNPVENAGVLAMSLSEAKSMMTMGEYDSYVSSNPTVVDYSNFANMESFDESSVDFMGEFASAVASLGDFGGACDCGFSGSSTGGSFASIC